jgi:Arc/MetJ family transcription regulator
MDSQFHVYIQEEVLMPKKLTSIRLDTKLADEAVRVLGVSSRTEAVHVALKEIAALKRFKSLMKKYGGKLTFANYDE